MPAPSVHGLDSVKSSTRFEIRGVVIPSASTLRMRPTEMMAELKVRSSDSFTSQESSVHVPENGQCILEAFLEFTF